MRLHCRRTLQFCLLLALLGIFESSSAQIRDTSFIKIPDRPWTLRLHETNKFFTTTFRSSLDSVPDARFKPNENPGLGIAVFRKSLGIWLAVNLPSSAEEERLKGARQHYDFQFNLYGKRFGIDGYLQYFQGFYLQNTRDFGVDGPDLPYLQRPDLNSLSMGLNVYHIFNWKKFSLGSAFIQSEIQKKSVGSFILGGGFARHSFAADSAILPKESRSQLAEESFKAGLFHALTISPGYMYTFVFQENWYVNASATLGLGGVYRTYTIESGELFSTTRGMLRFQGRMAAGYNAEKYFAGVSAVYDRYDLSLSKADLQYRWGNVRVFLGFRPDW